MKNFCFAPPAKDLGLFLLRVAAAVVFMYHGWLKLDDMAATEGFFSSLGIPAAGFMAWVIAILEFVGGIALLLGVQTRSFAFLLGVNMIVALLVAHFGMSYQAAELPIVLLGAMFVLWTQGAGNWRIMKEEWICGSAK
jgi:putative oxidoreductase